MDEVSEVVEMATESNPHANVIFIIILVLVATVFVLENIKKFKEILGIKNRFELMNDDQNNEIKSLKSEMEYVKKDINELKTYSKDAKDRRVEFEREVTKTLQQICDDMLEEKTERLRSEILDFASGVKTRNYNQESYTHIFDLYSKYEKLIKDNGLVNGYVEVSMEYIRKRYAQQLENGFADVDQ